MLSCWLCFSHGVCSIPLFSRFLFPGTFQIRSPPNILAEFSQNNARVPATPPAQEIPLTPEVTIPKKSSTKTLSSNSSDADTGSASCTPPKAKVKPLATYIKDKKLKSMSRDERSRVRFTGVKKEAGKFVLWRWGVSKRSAGLNVFVGADMDGTKVACPGIIYSVAGEDFVCLRVFRMRGSALYAHLIAKSFFNEKQTLPDLKNLQPSQCHKILCTDLFINCTASNNVDAALITAAELVADNFAKKYDDKKVWRDLPLLKSTKQRQFFNQQMNALAKQRAQKKKKEEQEELRLRKQQELKLQEQSELKKLQRAEARKLQRERARIAADKRKKEREDKETRRRLQSQEKKIKKMDSQLRSYRDQQRKRKAQLDLEDVEKKRMMKERKLLEKKIKELQKMMLIKHVLRYKKKYIQIFLQKLQDYL